MANNRYETNRYGRSQGRSSEGGRDRNDYRGDYSYENRNRPMDEGPYNYEGRDTYQSRGLYDPREAAEDQNYFGRGIESDLNDRTNREFSRDFNRENDRGLMEDYARGSSRNYRGGFGGHFDREMSSDYDRNRNMRYDRDDNETLHAGKGPKGWRRSDENIREQVCDSLERDNLIDASEIEVAVKEGIVTLSGKVDTRQAKRRAEDVIENLSGVKDVRNELSVDRNLFQQAKDFMTGSDSEQTAQQASKTSSRAQSPRH